MVILDDLQKELELLREESGLSYLVREGKWYWVVPQCALFVLLKSLGVTLICMQSLYCLSELMCMQMNVVFLILGIDAPTKCSK